MKNLLKTLIAAVVLMACAGCSKDDESSVRIDYDPRIHAEHEIYIAPMESDSPSSTYTHRMRLTGAGSLTVELNPGNYYIGLNNSVVRRGFQIRKNKQTRLYITDNHDVTVSY